MAVDTIVKTTNRIILIQIYSEFALCGIVFNAALNISLHACVKNVLL